MSGGAPPQLPPRHSHRPATSAPQKHGGPVARPDWALVPPLGRWRPLLAEAGGDVRGRERGGTRGQHAVVSPFARGAVVESSHEPLRFGTPAPREAVAGEYSGGGRRRGFRTLAPVSPLPPRQIPPNVSQFSYLEMGPVLRRAPNVQELRSSTWAPCPPSPRDTNVHWAFWGLQGFWAPSLRPVSYAGPVLRFPSSALGPRGAL